MEPSANQRASAVKSPIPEERTGKPTGETKNTSSDNKEHSGANPPEQQIGTSGDADRTALIVVAVIAAVLALCLLGLAVIFMRNKRKFIRYFRSNTCWLIYVVLSYLQLWLCYWSWTNFSLMQNVIYPWYNELITSQTIVAGPQKRELKGLQFKKGIAVNS